MYYQPRRHNNNQSGFTIVEILIATAIFIIVVSAMLVLLSDIIRINRQVQAIRTVVQVTRSFSEALSREIRNGRIDYDRYPCSVGNPEDGSNNYNRVSDRVPILTKDGDHECLWFTNASDGTFQIALRKITALGDNPGGDIVIFDSSKIKIDYNSLHFYVRPGINPNQSQGENPAIPGTYVYSGMQPFVTMTARFEALPVPGVADSVIYYQTTISTDAFDIPPKYPPAPPTP